MSSCNRRRSSAAQFVRCPEAAGEAIARKSGRHAASNGGMALAAFSIGKDRGSNMEGLMIELGWSAPARRVDAGTARRGVLSQHECIRNLLERARLLAETALDGRAPSPDAVASAIGDIRSTMEVHLAFEEAVLLPLLRDDLPIGPQRAERLLDEHERQREVLAGLHKEACAYPELPTLAAKLAFLTAWLLADMAEEERCLLTPEVIRDDVVVVDQADG